jgi:Serine dehydrogenase proteinase
MSAAASSVAERDSNSLIEQQLDGRLQAVEGAANADGLTYIGPIDQEAVDIVKFAVEERGTRRRALIFVLETYGGYMDAAERIAKILRHHYPRVDFLVPNFAMSAGTVLVMSGDAIHMDYSSVLGPIDPQVERGDQLVPALGYLEQYRRLIEKSAKGELTTAELIYLVQRFDPAELYRYEQEEELSVALLEDWLVRFKFKNWKQTETKKVKVTPEMRKDRARKVAEMLNKTDYWHSHSRGIPMEVLRRNVKLVIDDFGADATLGPAVTDYYRLLKDYMMRRGHYYFTLHRRGKYVGF